MHARQPRVVRWILIVAILVAASSASAYYSPRQGRWLSRDLIGEQGGLNLYQFVGNDPVDYVDPYGLWKQHGPLLRKSYDQFWAWREQQPGAGGNPGKKCRKHIFSILDAANSSQDDGQSFKENFRHYNRDLNEPVAQAKTKYRDYIAKEIGWFEYEMNRIEGPCDTDAEKTACTNALWSLGRVTHTWQDYYAHAVLANGKAGPAWAANPPITGSPDNDNDQLKPSSWGSYTNTGEHGVSEPASRDKPGGEAKRKKDAEDFVFEKFKTHLHTWYNKCWCCCPQK